MPVDPALLLAATGLAVLHRRGADRHPEVSTAATWRFAVALLVLLVALGSALERAAEVSFAWHMAQHQLLTLVVAPLIASSAPLTALRAGAGRPDRTTTAWSGDAGVRVLLAATVSVGTLLLWHLPPLYDAALTSPLLHRLEHGLLLGTALLAWGAVVVTARDDRAAAAVLALAASAIVGAALGVVLLTAPAPLYGYAGASALVDQQLGGALMKVGALLVHAGAAVWIGTRWLARVDAVA